jgi:hypothetical protein
MKLNVRHLLLLVPVALAALVAIPVTQTGCTTVNGTNTFDVVKAAKAIKTTLGPLVVFAENSDATTIPYFQDASATLGVLINTNGTDLATLTKALEGLGKTPLIKLAIDEALGNYSNYLADSVTAGLNQNQVAIVLIRDGFKAALDEGVAAQVARLKAHRKAMPHK